MAAPALIRSGKAFSEKQSALEGALRLRRGGITVFELSGLSVVMESVDPTIFRRTKLSPAVDNDAALGEVCSAESVGVNQ